MRPVNVTGDPASCFSMVTVRTGRTCGADASESAPQPARSADNAKAGQIARASRPEARECAMLPDIWLALLFVDQANLGSRRHHRLVVRWLAGARERFPPRVSGCVATTTVKAKRRKTLTYVKDHARGGTACAPHGVK